MRLHTVHKEEKLTARFRQRMGRGNVDEEEDGRTGNLLLGEDSAANYSRISSLQNEIISTIFGY